MCGYIEITRDILSLAKTGKYATMPVATLHSKDKKSNMTILNYKIYRYVNMLISLISNLTIIVEKIKSMFFKHFILFKIVKC